MVPAETGEDDAALRGPRTVDQAGAADLTLVIEKLEGACLRCRVPATAAEVVSFQLAGPLRSTPSLAMWLTNSTVSFVHVGQVAVHDGAFRVTVPRDTMITLSTTTGQAKGQAATCTGETICSGVYRPFPFPYSATYDDGEVGRMAKYHADNGGAFEIRADATGGGKHLLQASPRYPAGTQWAGNFDPITSLGCAPAPALLRPRAAHGPWAVRPTGLTTPSAWMSC